MAGIKIHRTVVQWILYSIYEENTMYMHKQVDCASYVQEFCNNIKAIYASQFFLLFYQLTGLWSVKNHNAIICTIRVLLFTLE